MVNIGTYYETDANFLCSAHKILCLKMHYTYLKVKNFEF